MKAMILAAGLGTRLKPFTNSHPKALAPVNGKSVLQRNVEYLKTNGITDIIVNVHHFADQIIDAVNKNNGWGTKITISDESSEVLETGGGIKKAAWFFENEPEALVMNADVLTNMPVNDMLLFHQKNKPLATLATSGRISSRFLLFGKSGELVGWKNEKTGEAKGNSGIPRAFSGLQILSRDFFDLMPTGKHSIIDTYLDLCTKHQILSYDHSKFKMMDIGTVEKLAKASAVFRP